MLSTEKTIKKFKYDPISLSKGSHKLVIRECDTCGKEDEVQFRKLTPNCSDCRGVSISKNSQNIARAGSKRLKKMWAEGDERFCTPHAVPEENREEWKANISKTKKEQQLKSKNRHSQEYIELELLKADITLKDEYKAA